ncbi:hypothetical protein [Alicyclobacillus dauci]|uniref:Uncharacterized protein n=1 Tax=Alicyclobacillus dauci TaxID=1475485 RepID=A0ABY6Z1I7_9BACL|nr:hypothetical protein [Alicyclobacillus dauci]WAH35840.1 hypothetical protein NZD86_16425 [Alicyclobacillus dauci]
MFTMRQRSRVSAKLFMLPVLLIALFCAAAVFDYLRQHVRVQMLGTSIDVSRIQQVLIEPDSAPAGSSQGNYTLTSQQSILKLCRLLATAQQYEGNEGDFATDIDSLLIESGGNIIRIPIARTSTNVTLLFYNAHSYVAPDNFFNQVQAIAAGDAQSKKANQNAPSS